MIETFNNIKYEIERLIVQLENSISQTTDRPIQRRLQYSIISLKYILQNNFEEDGDIINSIKSFDQDKK